MSCRTDTVAGKKIVVIDGKDPGAAAMEDVVQQLKAEEIDCVLCDMTATHQHASPMDLYSLVNSLGHSGLYGIRIAVADGLCPDDRHLVELMATNRGYELSCHTERDAAITWLTAE